MNILVPKSRYQYFDSLKYYSLESLLCSAKYDGDPSVVFALVYSTNAVMGKKTDWCRSHRTWDFPLGLSSMTGFGRSCDFSALSFISYEKREGGLEGNPCPARTP